MDFFISFIILLMLMLHYGIVPGMTILALPVFILLAVMTALGLGLWLAAINVKYRDVRDALPFLMQLWLFATPIAYSSSEIPEQWRVLYGLNPMVGVVQGFRWSLLGQAQPPGLMTAVSAISVFLLLVSGFLFFRSREDYFADVVWAGTPFKHINSENDTASVKWVCANTSRKLFAHLL